MAAMLDWRNKHAAGHIVTIEDPVEYIHTPIKSIFTQRELGIDTNSWSMAVQSAMRQAPAVVCAGGSGALALNGIGSVHRHMPTTLPRLPRWIKKGEPMSAVITPAPISPGKTTMRPITSASRRRTAARSAETGRSSRWFGPLTARAMWGEARPMKAMGPQAAVALSVIGAYFAALPVAYVRSRIGAR